MAVILVWHRLFGIYLSISHGQHDGIVFAVRELPRRTSQTRMMPTPRLLSQRAFSRRLE